jgi:hypothetical protein
MQNAKCKMKDKGEDSFDRLVSFGMNVIRLSQRLGKTNVKCKIQIARCKA